tara:strand:+ start:505 stop:801 length:297 start_codon:yes stop_codon:yes gene_type:complete
MKKISILSFLILFSGSSLATVAEDKIDAQLERLSQEKMMKQVFVEPEYKAHIFKRESLSENYPHKTNRLSSSAEISSIKNEYAGVQNKRNALSETYIN